MTTTRNIQSTNTTARLHMAFDLGWREWKLAFTIGHAQARNVFTGAKSRSVCGAALKRLSTLQCWKPNHRTRPP